MTKRLFIGIKVSPSEVLHSAFDDIKTQLSNEKIKWVAEKNLHFTLKFLGDVDIQCIDNISDILQGIAQQFSKENVKIKNLGVFPNVRRPRVLWFGLENFAQISKIAQSIENHLENVGIEKSDKEFRPHLTIGRVKFLKDIQKLQSLIDKYSDKVLHEFTVTEFDLIESILKPQGPVYVSLQSFKLK